MDLLSAAESELAELEKRISDINSLIVRRDQLKSFISIGRTLYASQPGQSSLPTITPVADAPVAEATRSDTQKQRIVDAAATLIAVHGPMRTRDLLAHMQAQGVEVGGANKIDTISVALTRSRDRFKSNGRSGGWVLLGSETG